MEGYRRDGFSCSLRLKFGGNFMLKSLHEVKDKEAVFDFCDPYSVMSFLNPSKKIPVDSGLNEELL